MHTHRDLQIIAFVGLAGSGKSTAVTYLTDKGYPKVYFGGIVLDEIEARGLERNPENEKIVREALRNELGPDVLAQKIIAQIEHLHSAGQRQIVIDGLYSWSEYKALKHAFPGELTVVAVTAPRHLRYHRLTTRPIRPFTEQEAAQRDWDEIEHLEKGGPIAIADYTLLNTGEPSDLFDALESVITTIDFEK